MESVSSSTSSGSRSTNSRSTAATNSPGDLAAFGLILDRSHAGMDFPLNNERGQTTFRLWQRQPQFSYCVLAGELHRPNGGFIGGLAADWPAALTLFSSSYAKLDRLAVGRGMDFSSAWFFLLSDEEAAEVRELMAARQAVAWSA